MMTPEQERAHRAVKTFDKLLPSMSAFARALTGKNVSVKMGANTATDGLVIYIMPPISLGDEVEHRRAVCGDRGDDEVMVCPACAQRETIVTSVFHELAHLCFGSFDTFKMSRFRERVEMIFDDERRDRVLATCGRVEKRHGYTSQELAATINPFLVSIQRALEDVRVDTRMAEARAGTAAMRRAMRNQTAAQGYHRLDGALMQWSDMPINGQMTIAMLCSALNHNEVLYSLDPYVTESVMDSQLQEILAEAPLANGLDGTLAVSLRALARAQELGFFLTEDEDQDFTTPSSPSEEEDEEEQDESNEEESDEQPEESEPSDAGDEGDHEGSESGADEEVQPDSSEEDSPGDDGGSDDPSEQEDSGAGSDSDDEAREDDGDGDVGEDGLESPASEDDTGDGDGDSEAGESDEPTESSSEGGGDAGIPDNESGPEPAEESDESGAGGGEVQADDEQGASGDGGDYSGADEESDGEDVATASGSQAVKPEGDFGSADEVESILDDITGHDEDLNSSDESSSERKLIEETIETFEHFEGPSHVIKRVHIARLPAQYGRKLNDFDQEIGESLLGPSLLQMRRAFADNARAARQGNRRSGRVNARVLGRRAWSDDDRLFTKKTLPGKRDYAVLIGIDISGSTQRRLGRRELDQIFHLEMRAAYAQAELCARAGIKFAVYAHSGLEIAMESLDIYEIKRFDQPWDKEAKDKINRLRPKYANLDGHTLEYYRKRLDEVNATNKILMYYSDGAMPAENYDEELDILEREIKICRKKDYILMAVGVLSEEPKQYGMDTVMLRKIEDIADVVKHLGKRLAELY